MGAPSMPRFAASAFAAAAIAVALAAPLAPANAAPLPGIAAGDGLRGASLIEKAGWRRWRWAGYHRYWWRRWRRY